MVYESSRRVRGVRRRVKSGKWRESSRRIIIILGPGAVWLGGERAFCPVPRRSARGPETTPAGRSIHHFPPFDPEHQQFPSPIIRAERVPEAPFVALKRPHVQARGANPRTASGRLGVEVESATLGDAFREVATFFFLGVLCECLWVAPVRRSSIVLSVAVCRSLVGSITLHCCCLL